MKFRTYIILGTLVFVIGGGLGFVWPTIAQTPQQQLISKEGNIPVTRKLFAKNSVFNYQPDSPLQPAEITEVSYSYGDTINISLTNTSAKIIRAYVIELNFYSGNASAGKTIIHNNIATSSHYILPGNPIVQSLALEDLTTADKMTVNLDFVEFNDGSTWGKDQTNYRETLQDFRAGALAATTQLLQLADQQGTAILVRNFQLSVVPTTVLPENRFQNFLHGARSIQQLIHNAGNPQKAQETLSTIHQEMQRMVPQSHVAQ
jgi:hypothetical protein